MRASAFFSSERVGTFMVFRVRATAWSTISFPRAAPSMAFMKCWFSMSSPETWVKTSSPRSFRRSKMLLLVAHGRSFRVRADLTPRIRPPRLPGQPDRPLLSAEPRRSEVDALAERAAGTPAG